MTLRSMWSLMLAQADNATTRRRMMQAIGSPLGLMVPDDSELTPEIVDAWLTTAAEVHSRRTPPMQSSTPTFGTRPSY
jgi:hypothetical protein